MKQPMVLVMMIGFIAVISFVVASQQAKTDDSTTAALSGVNEVRELGDADGSGLLRFSVKTEQRQFCYELTTSNINAPTSATINAGVRDTNGTVMLNLEVPENGRSQGCVSMRAETLSDITANPSRYYVNVTNAEFPNGAIRGQLK